jgi:hypothetical protein
MYIGFHVKCPWFFSEFNETWIFSTDMQKKDYQISWKSVQWEPTDGEADMTNLIVAFLNSENASELKLRLSKLKFPISF